MRYRPQRFIGDSIDTPLRSADAGAASDATGRRRASPDNVPAPVVAISRNAKQYMIANSPPLPPIAGSNGQKLAVPPSPESGGQC